MLKIIRVKSLSRNSISIGKDSIVDGINNGDSKVSRVKFKNIVILDFLAKFILLVHMSSGMGFLTLKAKLVFTKLRQIFIKVSIFYHFNLKYYI